MQKVKQVTYAEISAEDGSLINPEILLSPIPLVRTPYNSRYYPKHYEEYKKPSLTIPNESMTITELVKRFANGLPLGGGRVPLYESEGDMPDLRRLDLAERQEYIEGLKEEIAEIVEKVNKRKADAEEARLNKIVEERVAQKQKEGINEEEKPK